MSEVCSQTVSLNEALDIMGENAFDHPDDIFHTLYRGQLFDRGVLESHRKNHYMLMAPRISLREMADYFSVRGVKGCSEILLTLVMVFRHSGEELDYSLIPTPLWQLIGKVEVGQRRDTLPKSILGIHSLLYFLWRYRLVKGKWPITDGELLQITRKCSGFLRLHKDSLVYQPQATVTGYTFSCFVVRPWCDDI